MLAKLKSWLQSLWLWLLAPPISYDITDAEVEALIRSVPTHYSASALSAFGTTLSRGDGASPEAFTALAEVTDVSGMGIKMPAKAVTSSTDAANKAETKIPLGYHTYENIRAKINWIPTNSGHKAVLNDIKNVTKRNYKIGWGGGTGDALWGPASCAASFTPNAAAASELSADIELEILDLATIPST